MISHRYTRSAVTVATTLALAACAAPYMPESTTANSNYPASAQSGNTVAAPAYYRGTESGVSAVNNDATINANVLAAMSRLTGQSATNLQVSTYNGVVTLKGVANTSVAAQNNVQTARQVPGVQRVDYDIQVLRP